MPTVPLTVERGKRAGTGDSALGSGPERRKPAPKPEPRTRHSSGDQIVLDASFPSKDAAPHEVPAERFVT